MLKQFLLLAGAGAAAAASLPPRDTTPQASSKILMSTGKNILLADFDGAGFSIASQRSVPFAATWLAYAKPDRLFAVDENGVNTTLLGIDLAAGKLEEGVRAVAQGSSGV
ncbi:hypothetical protein E4U41_005402, partial [Claviceps citrina]